MTGRNTTDLLAWFEMPAWALEPMLKTLRLANTAFDTLFYDVAKVAGELAERGIVVTVTGDAPAADPTPMGRRLSRIDLGALSNPEGRIIVVDSRAPPYLTEFTDVQHFLEAESRLTEKIDTVSITGVGSSALGSVAFAWNVSAALDRPVAAIVPGYGVADVIEQALGGWLGFGLYGQQVKSTAQNVLADTAPATAAVGRRLMMSVPGHEETPVFLHGSGSSDVLHALLGQTPTITRLVGHSKGALVIENALRGLPEETTSRLHVTTFGCPVAAQAVGARYWQFLGCFDPIGWLNSWGNEPDAVISADHSTNTRIPLSMWITALTRTADADESTAPPRPV